MKAQFKYAFRAGLYIRGAVFGAIFTMNLVFIVLGSLGLLPVPAQITAVALGGVAIAVMLTVDIISDVFIASRMFSAPGAYLHALTPAPRRQILLASVLTMAAMDITTMAIAITGEVWLAYILEGNNFTRIALEAVRTNTSAIMQGIWLIALLIAGYLLIMMIIMFCITANKSLFCGSRVNWLFTTALALAVVYIVSLSALLLAPFGSVNRIGMFFIVSVGSAGAILFVLMTFIQATVLFVLTSRLMERKMNI